MQEADGGITFPGGQGDECDQADQQATNEGQYEPELDIHFYAEEWHNRHDKERGHQIEGFVHSDGGQRFADGDVGGAFEHQAFGDLAAPDGEQEVQEDAHQEELDGFESADLTDGVEE